LPHRKFPPPPVLSGASVPSDGALFVIGMGTCHAVASFQGHLVGSQVEVKMLEAAGFDCSLPTREKGISEDPEVAGLPEPAAVIGSPEGMCGLGHQGGGRVKVAVVRRFEFDHARHKMTVIVAVPREGRKSPLYVAITKGSYEAIASSCDPLSIPEEFLDRAKGMALEGCYVLGMGCKFLTPAEVDSIVVKAETDRDSVEKNLRCLGLIALRNELKDDSAEALGKLKEGAVRSVIITGDNAQCGQ